MTPDSSAIVAAFAPWHPLHDRARRALRGIADLVAHAELETYSVLTRLPSPFKTEPPTVADYLQRRHPGERLVLPPARRRALLEELASNDLGGGRVYDALIAVTASHHGHELATCDRRATLTYERVGAAFKLLA